MSKNIAIISGKGGSGKTSLSLAFAKALSDSNLKVLLVDCDMCTHGATFFMKHVIEKNKKTQKNILSVDDILISNAPPPFGFLAVNTISPDDSIELEKLLHVENSFYFLPSDISISNTNSHTTPLYFQSFELFLKEEIDDFFDVILLDCQAGYSDFTRSILKNSDIALLVSEPDAVSASANRALCFQMTYELEKVESYQIFSKLTSEEEIHYSKITTSGFFENSIPILYDLECRRTFMHLNIPSAESVNPSFEKRIIRNLQIMLPEHSEKFEAFKQKIFQFQQEELKEKLYEAEQAKKKEKNKIILKKLFITVVLLLYIIYIILTLLNKNLLKDDISQIITIVLSAISFLLIDGLLSNKQEHSRIIERQIKQLKKELRNLE